MMYGGHANEPSLDQLQEYEDSIQAKRRKWWEHEFEPDYGPGCKICSVPFESHWSSMTTINVVTHASQYPQRIMQDLVDALQIQVSRDFAPAWGLDAKLKLLPAGSSPPLGSWVLGLFDNSDQAGALGYHDVTPDGLPLGKVFATTTLNDGGKVSVTASHELLEMLGDPDVNLSAEVDSVATGAPSIFYAYEVCDAVELDSLGYGIQASSGRWVWVSDFVFPSWFESFLSLGSAQFDFKRHVDGPLQLAAGGYISFLDLSNLGAGWQQITARLAVPLKFGLPVEVATVSKAFPAGSRRARRAGGVRVRSTYQSGVKK